MGKISYSPQSIVMFQGLKWRVIRAVSASELMLEQVETLTRKVVDVVNLSPEDADGTADIRPMEGLHPDDWAEAQRRMNIIGPVLDGQSMTMAVVAKQAGIGERTLRRWLRMFESNGRVSDLAPHRRGAIKPKQTSPKVEAVMQKVIEETVLTRQRFIAQRAYELLQQQCAALNLQPPHINTFRRRVAAIPEREKLLRQRGRKAAHDRFGEVKGKFPDADYPQHVIQIDHTLLDIELVDDETRQPIGRPWLTLAIDVFSRMVTGFYLSLDPPSAFSVGMCLSHSALGKEADLERLGVRGEWNVWGLPKRIHADNGRDFRSKTLIKACQDYRITITWRLVRTPHYGGHIERLLGTFAKEVHALPGTTFSNIQQKGEYTSDKHATMTYHELECWLTNFIVGVYHQRVHRGIGCPPVEQWRRGIVGHGKVAGIGLPEPVLDPRRFWRDWLPYVERAVQRDGISWDKVVYYGDALRPWIHYRKGRQMQKFIVRRDPRDISRIYFFDPELGDYLEIPYRDLMKPSISIWEYREAERFLRDQGKSAENEDAIFDARAQMLQIVDQAKVDTRKVRRMRQRRKHNEQAGIAPKPHDFAAPKAPPIKHLSLIVDNTVTPPDEYDIPDNWDAEFEEL